MHYTLKPFAALENGNSDPAGVLVNTHSADLSASNETGWVVLQALREGADVEALTAMIVARFDVEEGDARRDIIGFIRKLVAMGLVNEGS